MPNLTTNYSLNKPLVNNATDQDLWGGYLNDNMDTIDTQLLLCRDWKKRAITGTDSMVAGDRHKMLLCDATSAAFVETLLTAAAAGDGFEFTAVKTDSTGHAVTLTPQGADKIGGNATWPLTGQGDSATLVSDGVATWSFKGNKTTPSAVSSASTTVSGILKLATNALAQAGVDAVTAVTPAALASLVTLGAAGNIVIGGLRIQWGLNPSAVSPTINFTTAFSGVPYYVGASSGSFNSWSCTVDSANVSTSSFPTRTFSTTGAAVSIPIYWLAIGPA